MRVIFLAAVALGAALSQQGGGAKAPAPKTPVERSAPAGEKSPAAPVVEIKEAGLKELLGASAAKGRPLVVNFWATWCVPCREEFPDLVKIRGEYEAERLDFALVSLDDISDISKGVPQFLREARAEAMPSYLLNAEDSDAAINLVDPAWRGELPATFLYDGEGRQVYSHKGRIKPAELRAAIERALGARRDAPAQK